MNAAARIFVSICVAIFLMFICAAIGIVLLINIHEQSVQAAKSSESNAATLRVVLAVTGCEVNDTPKQCHDKIVAQSTESNNRRIAESDCLVRRAVANLPPLPKGETCVAP